ncbi:hypothetical protein [Methylobacterium sp. J-070]|uniref:hypothetical protein n=1 Tax=Methylobacterium sp. J-070 TaxID=2836650 RepID=UPI001FB93B37|nr:hypothetical protein [Methylobacterium sp. J-070]MCJ2049379.1 hypothetical protein [Methylobacterium sp. J-070]
MSDPEQGSAEAVYASAMVGEMMQRVLSDALVDLARTKGASYLDMFMGRELARYAICSASGRTTRVKPPACCGPGS